MFKKMEQIKEDYKNQDTYSYFVFYLQNVIDTFENDGTQAADEYLRMLLNELHKLEAEIGGDY